MGTFYLDIETTGINPYVDKIITIQFQELNRNSGEPIGELKILKAWESSEKEIIEQFIRETNIQDPYPFSFIAVGYNLGFEHNFLRAKSKEHRLKEIDILNNPFIDLRAIGILMNNGEFKGSSLDKISGKERNGSSIPSWFANKEYEKIINYIEDETKEFLKFCQWLYREMPKMRINFNNEVLNK